MPPPSASTGLTITNPLVLYRALLATKRIDPDPAQHRLALHLQKLYHRLKDYEPEIEYSQKLNQIGRAIGRSPVRAVGRDDTIEGRTSGTLRGIFPTFGAQRKQADTLALTRQLTSHESAIHLDSPQGLLLYGEVGTGKSMLVDLLADCLPNRKKRRWHFNTFMLETFTRLEQLRRSRLTETNPLTETGQDEEHSLLWLARDMISTSPILFLDEFQLPDRAASKILSNLFTSFFHLGGVLVATSNRMPEELANASGIEFSPPPASRLGLLGSKWGLLGSGAVGGKSENMFSGKGDFSTFLEVLRARCEVWDMEGEKDWRRREAELDYVEDDPLDSQAPHEENIGTFGGLETMAPGNWGLGYEQSVHTKQENDAEEAKSLGTKMIYPKHYIVTSSSNSIDQIQDADNKKWEAVVLRSLSAPKEIQSIDSIPWESTFLRVYGRNVLVTRHFSGGTIWSFKDLCTSNLGPADYISLASTFHTLILTDVPVLTWLQKNEARRLITLLDALYEARCKLLIRAEAGPDDLFFPEIRNTASSNRSEATSADETYAETFSEIYQDQTSPFRPNISSYAPSSSPPSYDASSLPSTPYSKSTGGPSVRSILADEDSDFGPVYGAGRSASTQSIHPSEPTSEYRNTRGLGDGAPGAGNEIGRALDFQRTGVFTGEDERFAYKRAQSRLWEMCGARWWKREEEGWWKPLDKNSRGWEGVAESLTNGVSDVSTVSLDARMGEAPKEVSATQDAVLFRHGASPFRTSQEPPPKFSWVHVWGMMKWGKKAGSWGQGVEGLPERTKTKPTDSVDTLKRK